MLTPQEVASRSFAKAAFGGYTMSMVDEFLDELTEDYTALYKENTALKAKMKILVDKIEEYRSTEDSMRTALLTAQKMATSMVAEAEEKKSSILADVEAEARRRYETVQAELAAEQQRLSNVKEENTAFIAEMRRFYEKQIALLDSVPEMEFSAPVAPVVSPEVSDIGQKIVSAFLNPEEEAQEESEPTRDIAVEMAAEELAVEPEAEPMDEEPETVAEKASRRFSLENLKFGRNYQSGV